MFSKIFVNFFIDLHQILPIFLYTLFKTNFLINKPAAQAAGADPPPLKLHQ